MRRFLLAALFCACSTGPAEMSADEKAVLGNWAGNFTAGALTLTVTLNNGENHAYTATTLEASPNTGILDRESGTWAAQNSRYISTAQTCETATTAGGPLSLVACGGADTLAINITGDTWNLNFLSGGTVYTLALKKL